MLHINYNDDYINKKINSLKNKKPTTDEEGYNFYNNSKSFLIEKDNESLFMIHNPSGFSFIAYKKGENTPFYVNFGSIANYSAGYSYNYDVNRNKDIKFTSHDKHKIGNLLIDHSYYSRLDYLLPLEVEPLVRNIFIAPRGYRSIDEDGICLYNDGLHIGTYKKSSSKHIIGLKYSHLDEITYDKNFEITNISLKYQFHKKIKEVESKKNFSSIEELNSAINNIKEIFPLLMDTELKTKIPDFEKLKKQTQSLSIINFNRLTVSEGVYETIVNKIKSETLKDIFDNLELEKIDFFKTFDKNISLQRCFKEAMPYYNDIYNNLYQSKELMMIENTVKKEIDKPIIASTSKPIL